MSKKVFEKTVSRHKSQGIYRPRIEITGEWIKNLSMEYGDEIRVIVDFDENEIKIVPVNK